MMKIKLRDLNDQDNPYLDKNPEFTNQLVTTLNQVDGLDPNQLVFHADSCYWTYDYFFSSNYEIDKDAFSITNGRICIQSRNRNDLLNLNYYQHLNHLANKYPIDPIKKQKWTYFPQDQVLQLETSYWIDTQLNIKLTKPIDQYSQNQLNAMGKLLTNVYDLIIKDKKLDWVQFDDQWKQGFDLHKIQEIGIVFNLNDFINPKILIRSWYGNGDNLYLNNDLKQVLKPDSELLKFLNKTNFQSHFQPYINQKLINSLKDF